MISFHAAKNRFSLYYLEENELYIQDLSAYVTFYDSKLNEERWIQFGNNLEKREENYMSVLELSYLSQNDQIYLYRSISTRIYKKVK